MLVRAGPQRFPSGDPGRSVLPPEAGTVKPTGAPSSPSTRSRCNFMSVDQRSWTRNRLFLIQLDMDLCAGPAGLFDLAHVEEFTSEESVQVLWEPSLEFPKNYSEVGRVFMCVRRKFSLSTSSCIQRKSFKSSEKKTQKKQLNRTLVCVGERHPQALRETATSFGSRTKLDEATSQKNAGIL